MQLESAEAPSTELQRSPAPETGPYVLRSLLEDVPLSADGDRDDIDITCVEFLGVCNISIIVPPVVHLLTRSRPKSLRGHIRLRTPPFCADTS